MGVFRRTRPGVFLAVATAVLLSSWTDRILAAAIVDWQHRSGLVWAVILPGVVASLLFAARPLWKIAASSAVWRKMVVDQA